MCHAGTDTRSLGRKERAHECYIDISQLEDFAEKPKEPLNSSADPTSLMGKAQ